VWETPEIEAQKPLDLLTEGLISEKSRGDKTPLELFVAGVRRWEAGLQGTFSGAVELARTVAVGTSAQTLKRNFL
jgi:hypothetical protein